MADADVCKLFRKREATWFASQWYLTSRSAQILFFLGAFHLHEVYIHENVMF